jgi:thiosulfate/3-mercaptopyruvate sulfurtransferase
MLAALLLMFAAAGYSQPDQLVETDWVAAHATDPSVRIVDMRTMGFAQGHMPGAVYLSPQAVRDANSPPTFLPTPAPLRADDGRARHPRCDAGVVYDERGGIHAARLWWILSYFGHENVALLNVGMRASVVLFALHLKTEKQVGRVGRMAQPRRFAPGNPEMKPTIE